MTRNKKIEEPKPLNTPKAQVSNTYKKPQVYVVSKTATLIRGDYGKNADQFRRYQD